MAAGKGSLLPTLVNSYAGALLSVSQTVGIQVQFLKTQVTPGVNAPGGRAAALIGIVGPGVHSTASVIADMVAFDTFVSAFTGGMIKANVDDPMSMSVLGELTNMVSGQALIKASVPGLDITPPQLLSGENIKTIPSKKAGVSSFTLPFKVGEGNLYLILSVHE
ncbi:chemotaxis protein CheX [Synergistales bacterium]|nr:chemotaxis protein CheX [Synergistales bacterium]GHV53099.1 chemotaxis protein CheX [Synergistales bacterium]